MNVRDFLCHGIQPLSCSYGLNAMRDGPCQVNSCGYGRGKVTLSLDAGRHQQQNPQPDGPPDPLRGSPWRMDSSSQACSGPEDNSTDQQETCAETSTLTYIDAHNMDESGENNSLRGSGPAEVVCFKVFVLIDDDDDGDMSLREKMVTDMSVMDGNAADLVGGRLLSTSSDSLSHGKAEPPGPEAPPLQEAQKNNFRGKVAVKSLVTKGVLVKTKDTGASGSFKVNREAKKAVAPKVKNTAVKKPAAVKKVATPKKAIAKSPKKVPKSPKRAAKPAAKKTPAKKVTKLKAAKKATPKKK
ncbi:unnamed protein product [Gadus morhua 'NCC']